MKKLAIILVLAVLLSVLTGCTGTPVVYTVNCTCPPAPEATEAPAETATEVVEEVPLGYILVQANGDGGWIPLPTTDEPLLVTITREDDPTISNTIRLWQTGFQMDSSTCDNQDCVQQGEVTLMNKDERVLMQYVLCLPHNISIELYSTEEILMMIEQAQAAQ